MPLKLPQDLFGSTALPQVEALDPSLMSPRQKDPSVWRKMLNSLIEDFTHTEARGLAQREMADRERSTGVYEAQVESSLRPKPQPRRTSLSTVGTPEGPMQRLIDMDTGDTIRDIGSLYEKPEKPAAPLAPIRVDNARGPSGPVTRFLEPGTFKPIADIEEFQKPPAPASSGMSDTARFNNTMRLKADWDKESSDARLIAAQVAKLSAAERALQSGDPSAVAPSAEALQVLFEKILDPTSVVREGEYARAALTQPVVNRIRGALDRVSRGGSGIPIDELRGYAELARQLAGAANQDAAIRRKAKEGTARKFGLDPADIFTDDIGVVAPPKTGGGVIEYEVRNGQLVRKGG